ncbi:glycosyltransferase family 2 protein [Parasediminibacterium sp. JCM 36343]|uniref:glycosyltransferase family 2 protein n=1 Tax=Parasediminibacterium sp. JCM 36343 TaxID=3374279 RepID=UPI00397CE4F5
MTSPSVAIVILNFNGKQHLQNFLPSVLGSTYANKRVVVADNASTDESISFVKEHFPSVEILVNNKNEGFAGGYNWALKLVESDYYVLLNSDVEVSNNWIEPIISLMEADASIAACQPKLISYKHRHLLEYAGASGGWIDKLGYPFSRGRIFDVLEEDRHQYDDIQEIFWASGAAMFVKSKVFHAAGGFDDFFFAHQEEIDLCWRMQLMGYRIMGCPQSVVYHVGAGTLPRGGRKVFLNFRNNLLMLSKNLTFKEKITIIPLRFLLDAISAWKGLFHGDKYFFAAISKAHFSVLGIWLRGYKTHSLNRVPICQLKGVYNGSVVYQYFILNKQYFYQIVDKKE